MHASDNVERAFVDEGEHEDVTVNSNGVLLSKVWKLVLTVRVHNGHLVLGSIHGCGPQEGVLARWHVLWFEAVICALNGNSALPYSTRAQDSDAFANAKGLLRRRWQVASDVVRVAYAVVGPGGRLHGGVDMGERGWFLRLSNVNVRH